MQPMCKTSTPLLVCAKDRKQGSTKCQVIQEVFSKPGSCTGLRINRCDPSTSHTGCKHDGFQQPWVPEQYSDATSTACRDMGKSCKTSADRQDAFFFFPGMNPCMSCDKKTQYMQCWVTGTWQTWPDVEISAGAHSSTP